MTHTDFKPIKDYCIGIYDGPHATPREADDGPIFLGIKNITDNGRLDFSEIRHVSEQEFPKWTKRVLPRDRDVVLTYEATLHRYAIIPNDFHGCLGRRVALIRPDPSKVDSRFLLYYFLSFEWRRVVEAAIINGATVDRLPLEKLPTFPVRFPGLHVQRSIAESLGRYDDLIENNRRRIELLERSARLLFEEWFVRLRYPEHEHDKLVNGCPEGWTRKPLSAIVDINPRERVTKGDELWYVPMASLSESGMLLDDASFERRTKHTTVKFRNGDTLFARITPCLENGKTGYVDFLAEGEIACGSTEFIVMRGTSVPSEFTYCLARQEYVRGRAIKSMIGSSGRQRVQESCFDDLFVNVPPDVLMSEFQEFATSCFAQIKNLRIQNQKLQKARDVLLPRLMDGRIAA